MTNQSPMHRATESRSPQEGLSASGTCNACCASDADDPRQIRRDRRWGYGALLAIAALVAIALILGNGRLSAHAASPAQQRGGDRWAAAGTRIGEKLPAVDVLTLNGERQPLASFWSTSPVLFVTSSVTCPVARGTCPRLDEIRSALKGTADVVVLYTTEAHPAGSASPYRPNGEPWVTKENEDAGILRAQPKSIEDRLALAREFKSITKTELPIAVDALDDGAWRALGGGPNMAVLVDRAGTVQLKQGWLDSNTIADAVKAAVAQDASKNKDTMTMNAPPRTYSASGFDVTPLPNERVAELAKKLSPEAFKVTQNHGTEAPGSCGILLDNKKDGTYCCVVCGLPLFTSEHKFNSGTGWPSFFSPVDAKHLRNIRDSSYGMERVEVTCARCNAHLGHVFDDGPSDKTGLRFCINGVALQFRGKDEVMPVESQPAIKPAVAYFAGGCFWGVEHVFQQCPGVIDAESGYMNGTTKNPTYEDVCGKKTGHAEVVKVIFDPSRVTFRQLLEGFFDLHDPTQLNRQGPDVGDQYRSAVFTVDAAQLADAKAVVAEISKSGRFKAPIVTVIEPAKEYYKAEGYHQDYVDRTGKVCHVSNPWPKIFGAAAAH